MKKTRSDIIDDPRVDNLITVDGGKLRCSLKQGHIFTLVGKNEIEVDAIGEICANLNYYVVEGETIEQLKFHYLNPLFENQYFTTAEIERWNKYLTENTFIWDAFYNRVMSDINAGKKYISARDVLAYIRRTRNPYRKIQDHVSPFLAFYFTTIKPKYRNWFVIKKKKQHVE